MRNLILAITILTAAHLTQVVAPVFGQQIESSPKVSVPVPTPAALGQSAPAQQQESPPEAAAPPQAPKAKPATPTVVLDPAHGGSDSGARGATGTVESELVLEFARAIRVALEGQGFRVLLTREGNEGPSLDARAAMVNGQRGAIFISLHVSSAGPPGTARTYWYSFPSDTPAATIAVTTSAAATPLAQVSAPAVPLELQTHHGLIQWNQAQRPFVASSQRLAETVQAQIAQKFTGSNAMPETASVLQLRTIAGSAIAIEVSSVSVPDAQQVGRMAAPLAEAVARGVANYRTAVGGER